MPGWDHHTPGSGNGADCTGCVSIVLSIHRELVLGAIDGTIKLSSFSSVVEILWQAEVTQSNCTTFLQ